MSKEAYFDMMEQMNLEPVDEDIPLDLNDFPDLVQTTFIIYSALSDIWDYMNGNYCGKDYSILFNLFELYGVDSTEERLMCMEFLRVMDDTRAAIIREKKPASK